MRDTANIRVVPIELPDRDVLKLAERKSDNKEQTIAKAKNRSIRKKSETFTEYKDYMKRTDDYIISDFNSKPSFRESFVISKNKVIFLFLSYFLSPDCLFI